MTMNERVKLSVIIPTFNRCRLLARILPAVFSQDFPHSEYEVVVVVDGSTDATASFLRTLQPSCALHVIEQANQGQAIALNRGIEVARGKWVLLLDDDCLSEPGLFQAHVNAHQRAEPAVIVGRCLVAQESPRRLAADWAQEGEEQCHQRVARRMKFEWPLDASVFKNCSASRSTLLAVGGFDESLARVRHFDQDLGIRLWKKGVKFLYEPRAVVHQIYVKTAEQLVRHDARVSGRNELFLFRKHPDARSVSALAALGPGSPRGRLIRQTVARSPISPEPLLRPAFWLAEGLRFLPAMRRLGIFLLKARQSIVLLRSALREAGSWEALEREYGKGLPVLRYQHVGPWRAGVDPASSVSAAEFERQVQWLAARGYVGIAASDWLAWRRESSALPDKPVLLTFDDACSDLTQFAFPVLRRHGFKAAAFVTPGKSAPGTPSPEQPNAHRCMTPQMIREWAAQGIEFGLQGGGCSGPMARSDPAMVEEIARDKAQLAGILGAAVRSFAYPRGRYTESMLECVRKLFDLAFTGEPGVNDLRTDLHLLRRICVRPGDRRLVMRCRLRWGWPPASEH